MPLPTIKDVLEGAVTFSLPEAEPRPTDTFEILGKIAEQGGVGRIVPRVPSVSLDEQQAAQVRANAVKARGLKRS